MGKIYGGVSGTAREVKKIYAGVNGVAKEISKVYAGVNGVAKLIWEADGGDWQDKYQTVEFIQGTGTQYINCGNVINSRSVMTAEFQLTTTTYSVSTYYIGATNGSDRFGCGISSGKNFIFGLGGGFHNRTGNTNRQTIIIDSYNKTINQNGTNRAATSGTYSSVQNPNWFGVLGAYNTDGVLTYGKVKVYYIMLRDATDLNMSHYYYPVYRKSDNEPGLFDIITKTFYANSGTGTIVVGNDVTVA